jgi:type IV pilus assembly protein PilY1
MDKGIERPVGSGRILRGRGPVVVRTTVVAFLLGWLASAMAILEAAGSEISLSAVPPHLVEGVAPNLVLTVDNSASMGAAFMPSGLPLDGPYFTSPDINQLYYDPWQTYLPGMNADGTMMPDAVFASADQFPYLDLDCYDDPVDLSFDYSVVQSDDKVNATCSSSVIYLNEVAPGVRPTGEPAYYFLYNPDNFYSTDEVTKSHLDCNNDGGVDSVCSACRVGFPDGPGYQTADSCFSKILVGSAADQALAACTDLGPSAIPPAGLTLKDADTDPDPSRVPGEICVPRDNSALGLDGEAAARQNFANWFVYHRSGLVTAKTALSRVMHRLDPRVRLTFQDIQSNDELWPGTAAFELLNSDGDGPRFGRYREIKGRFYQWLFALEVTAEKARLQGSHVRAGEFVASEVARSDDIVAHRGNLAAFAENSCGAKCRSNFHLLFTGGVWEDEWGDEYSFAGIESSVWPCEDGGTGCWMSSSPNQDGIGWTLPPMSADYSYGAGVTQYTPHTAATQVFSDDNEAMLADTVFRYWATDLDPLSANQVPPLIASWDGASAADSAANFWNPRNDPASWQHLSFSAVAFGVEGAVKPTDDSPFGTYITGLGAEATIAADGFPDGDPAADYDGASGPFYGWGHDFFEWYANQIPSAAKIDDLYHATINGRGSFARADGPDDLVESFSRVLATVSATAEEGIASAGVAFSGGQLDDSTLQFQAVVDTVDWRGELRAYRVSQGPDEAPCPDAGKERGEICEGVDAPYWTASDTDGPDSRTIITSSNGSGAAFTTAVFDSLAVAQQRGLLGCGPETDEAWSGDWAFCNDADGDASNGVSLSLGADQIGRGQAMIDYLRGGASNEGVGGFRERGGHWLGTILRSTPVLVGPPAALFEEPDYREFRDTKRGRQDVLYVGANDGMLHAFDPTDGTELFAYVPESLFPRLSDLARSDYGKLLRTPYVDGPLIHADAKFTDKNYDGGWKTVLVGSFGVGGQGVYALNISEPSMVTEGQAEGLPLWEFNDASGSDASSGALDGRDMGYSLAKPVVVRIDDDVGDAAEPIWVALVSNGFNNTNQQGEAVGRCTDGDSSTNCTISQTGNAVLYVLRLGGPDEERILAKLDTGRGFCQDPLTVPDPAVGGANCAGDLRGRTNALAQLTSVDADFDLVADTAYAGDLFGNVWRFDLTDLSSLPELLFSATDANGAPQPITAGVAVAPHPTGIGTMVLFGTGQYLNAEDKIDMEVQSLYGIWDDHGKVFPSADGGFSVPSRAQLLQQELLAEITVTDENGVAASLGRSSTDYPADWSAGGHRGWLLDLKLQGAVGDGERVVVSPQVRNGRVVFVSMTPEDCCSAGGVSWITALDAADGSRPSQTPFDYTLDGYFTVDDLLVAEEGAPAIPGSSIRVLTDGGSGVYSAPATLGLGADGAMQSVIADSDGDMIRLRESTALSWRSFIQLE